MVGTAMTIERDIEDARSTRDTGASGKRKESQSASSSGKKPMASSSQGFYGHGPGLLNQDQPLEVFLSCYTLVNRGAWASTVPVEGPGSTSPRWKDLGPHYLFL